MSSSGSKPDPSRANPQDVKVGLLVTVLLALCTSAFAASYSGTLNAPAKSGATASQNWTGSVTGVIGDSGGGLGLINPPCDSTICDIYTLQLNVPATFYRTNPNYAVHVNATFVPNAPVTDIDIYIYDASGNLVCDGTSSSSTQELVDCGPLASGTYQVQIVPCVAVQQAYNGQIILQPEPSSTPMKTGLVRYGRGNFTFSSPTELVRPSNVESTGGTGLFLDTDGEPRLSHDALGNLYVAATQGVPAGSDMWSSVDGGTTWNYLGEPDGAAALNVISGTNGVGVGGGDEDLIALPNGQVDMTSLWLGSNTTCTSGNEGNTWLCNPNGSTVPDDDRQWLANYGNNIVYITSKNLGTAEAGPDTLYVAKSTDGGKTFPTVTLITTPELGIQPGDQGNLITDTNGNVYNVFFDTTGSILYMAKSTDGGGTWMIKQVYAAPCSATSCTSLAHVFPAIAADSANNLYIVFSDGTNSYYTSSIDGGATWRLPTIVQSGFGLKSTVEPWVIAGSPGKINIFYYGTTDRNFMDNNANWVVYMAQSLNALAAVPTFSIVPATPFVIHTGAICNQGTGCASGTRTMLEYFFPDTYVDGNADAVYPDSVHVQDTSAPNTAVWFVKQTGGSRITGQ
jgi:hypothetical protein